ncbi:MAG: hypothetical protein R3B13_06015 [Polyangiaceae bacterium]
MKRSRRAAALLGCLTVFACHADADGREPPVVGEAGSAPPLIPHASLLDPL